MLFFLSCTKENESKKVAYKKATYGKIGYNTFKKELA